MPKPSGPQAQWSAHLALGACLAATLLAVGLHLVYLAHAGALWRDEASIVQLATLKEASWHWRLAHDSFPIFFFALVRLWSALGLGAGDFTLRILGFLIGLALLGAMWLNARLMGIRWPSVSLGLLAANLAIVRWGDSLRPYGCGSLFILLTLGLIWKLVQAPGRASFLLAGVAAILSVQTLYQNAFLVLAACLGGCVVCARHRQWKTTALVLGVGLVAALSLVPCLPLLRNAQDYLTLFKAGFSADAAWSSLSFALGAGRDWPLWVWLGLAVLVFGVAWQALFQRGGNQPVGSQDLVWFGGTALAAGIAAFLVFLHLAEFEAAPWYFLPLMVLAAAALEAVLANTFRPWSFWPSACAAALACAMFPTTLKLAKSPQTNVGLIAAELQSRAKPGDFIVISPCFCGITFARYFKAPIAWTTFPPMDDYRCHRMDLMKKGLCSKSLLEGVLAQAARTLASGHTLWVTGTFAPPAAGVTDPPDLPPATAPAAQ